MGPLTNIIHYSPHIIQLGFSQNMLIISLLKLDRKLHYSHTKPNIIWLWAKLKERPNSKSPTTMWLISKPTTTRHYLQSPLRRDTIYKNRYDATLFTKSVTTRQLKVCCYTAILYKISKLFFAKPKY